MEETITSRRNPLLAHTKKLLTSRAYREKSGEFAADGVKLQKGSVISNEPGLYIDEWEIGIRIEDDLLITEDGCKVLSESIIKEPDEIENFMATHKK